MSGKTNMSQNGGSKRVSISKKNKRRNRNKEFESVKAPVVRSGIARYNEPILNGKKEMIMKHCEFIGNVEPSLTFSIKSWDVNPGLKTFTWLSTLASSFEKYRWLRLRILYKTSQSALVSGFVAMAPEFDVLDENPTSKEELYAYKDLTRGPVWKDFSVEIALKDMRTYPWYFVRNEQNRDIGTALNTFDAFRLILGVSDVSSELTLGEIWIEYEIEFLEPQIQRSLTIQNSSGFVEFQNGTIAVPFSQGVFSKHGCSFLEFHDNPSVLSFKYDWTGIALIRSYAPPMIQNHIFDMKPVFNYTGDIVEIVRDFVGGTGELETQWDHAFDFCGYIIWKAKAGSTVTVSNLASYDSGVQNPSAIQNLFIYFSPWDITTTGMQDMKAITGRFKRNLKPRSNNLL